MSRELLELRQQYAELQDAYSKKCVELTHQARVSQSTMSYALKMKRTMENIKHLLAGSDFSGRHQIEEEIAKAESVNHYGI